MKKDRILNPRLIAAVASIGHTDFLCIADCGLPIPLGVECIDVSVCSGIPGFIDVLRSIESELVIDSYICASEIKKNNPNVIKQIEEILREKPMENVDHEDFKKLAAKSKYIIRTGEASPYANVILVGGVNF